MRPLSDVFSTPFSTVAEIAPICDLLSQDPNLLCEIQDGFTVFNKLTQLLGFTSNFQAYLITFLLDILPRIDTHRVQLLLTPDLNNNSPLHRLSYSSHYELLKKLIDVLNLDRDDLLRAFFKTNSYDESAFKNLVDPDTENNNEVLAFFLKDYFEVSLEQGREIVAGNQLNQLKQLIQSDDFHKTPFFKSTEFSIISDENTTYQICKIEEKEGVWYFEYWHHNKRVSEFPFREIAFLTESTPSKFSKFETGGVPWGPVKDLTGAFLRPNDDFIKVILEDYKIHPRRYFKRMIDSLKDLQIQPYDNNPFFPQDSYLTVDRSIGSHSAVTLRVNFQSELIAVFYFRWLKTIPGFQEISLQRNTKTPLLYIVFTRTDIQRLVEFVFPSALESKRNTWVDTIFTCAEKSMSLFGLFPQLPICDEEKTQLHFQNLKHSLVFHFFSKSIVYFMETGFYGRKGSDPEKSLRTFRKASRAAFILGFNTIIHSEFKNNTDVLNCFRLISKYVVVFTGGTPGGAGMGHETCIREKRLFEFESSRSGLIPIHDVFQILLSLNIISDDSHKPNYFRDRLDIKFIDKEAENCVFVKGPQFPRGASQLLGYTILDGEEDLPEICGPLVISAPPSRDSDTVILRLLNIICESPPQRYIPSELYPQSFPVGWDKVKQRILEFSQSPPKTEINTPTRQAQLSACKDIAFKKIADEEMVCMFELSERYPRETVLALEQTERTAVESQVTNSLKMIPKAKCFQLAACEIVSINHTKWCTEGSLKVIVSYKVPSIGEEVRTLTLYQDGSVQNRKFRDSFEEGLVKLLNALKIKFALTQKHLPFLDQYNFFFEQFEKIYDDYTQHLSQSAEKSNPVSDVPGARNQMSLLRPSLFKNNSPSVATVSTHPSVQPAQ